MHQNSTLLFALLILMSCYKFTSAIVCTNKSYTKNNFGLESSTASVTNYVKLNPAAMQNWKNSLNPRTYKLKCQNIDLPFQEGITASNSETHYIYSPSMNTITNYNDLNVAYNKRQNLQFQTINNSNKISESPNELSKVRSNYVFDPHQLARKSKDTHVSSNDHLQRRHLATFVAPSPSNLEIHLKLHHHIPAIIYKTATIESHATGNEPSPMTTESIKLLTSIKNVQHISATNSDEKLIKNNKINYYDNIATEALNINIPAPKIGSKQYLYAPLRSSLEKELPYNRNSLPYPPSFISITTTETPPIKYKPFNNNNIPDFFTHRQYTSLWDSYIPSWHIIKMLQQFKTNTDKNNLQTLAFSKQNKMKIEK